MPLAWSIELHGLPQIALDVLEAVRFLALDSGNVRLDQARRTHVDYLIGESRDVLMNSRLYLEAQQL